MQPPDGDLGVALGPVSRLCQPGRAGGGQAVVPAQPTVDDLLVVETLAVFQLFAEPYVVTQGGPFNSSRTAGLFLYQHITTSDLGTGAANSFLLVVLVFALSLVSVRLLRAKD